MANKKSPWNKGMKMPEEFSKKMSKIVSGRKMSEESKNKLSESRKKKFTQGLIANPFKGRKRTMENCKKISETRKIKISSGEIKMPIQKGKNYLELFGEERAIQIIKAKSKKNKGRKKTIQEIEKIKNGLKNRSYDSKKEWIKNISLTKKEQIKNNPELRIALINNRRNQVFPVKDTSIEVKIQKFLEELGIEYFTHKYIKEIEHGYQCDILVPSINLVIECDGNYWHKYPIGNEIDHIRTSELIENGFKVLRLWESEIKIMDLKSFERRLGHIKK